jgi:uncharacterized protein (DUF1800 family)
MRNIITSCIAVLISFPLYSQIIYDDYIGAGHSEGIVVTTSNNYLDATGIKTLDGSGMDTPKFRASRFLAQATLGADIELVNQVIEIGPEAWIDQQFQLPPSYLTPVMESIWQERLQMRIDNGEDPSEVFGPWAVDFNYAWWQTNMTNNDLLRHRVALALSEVLVVSIFSDLRDNAYSLTDYYDMLLEHAFGNYEDLMKDVTLHVSMGYYLSHLNNPKANPEENQRPDENYAREIMQLFSIGLNELNLDGTKKLDGSGNPIPTYDNNDIKEFAKVFTGLGPGAINMYVDWTTEPYFGLGFWGTDATVPMAMYEDFHEPGEKHLLNGYTIPAGQTGMEDIDDAINHLFNHPNVGPFIAYRLIQRLVKSNPSPAYVQRVASAFNGTNGASRGDMKNLIKAILLDPEARDDAYVVDEESSKLREPILRYTHLCRAIPLDSPLGRFWNNGFDALETLKQHPMASPTVFNFFLPDHSPVGEISDSGLVGPEFKLHNTSTSINYINQVNNWLIWWAVMYSWEGDYGDMPVFADLSQYEAMTESPDVFINEMDILFTHGQLTDETRQNIRQAMEGITWGDYREDRAKLGLYLLLISPDFNIMK